MILYDLTIFLTPASVFINQDFPFRFQASTLEVDKWLSVNMRKENKQIFFLESVSERASQLLKQKRKEKKNKGKS